MPANSRHIDPVNWGALVDEALRRRKAEGLTQREHAALAGVSGPTIVGFDRKETTLTLAKAFDILRVVGLIDEPAESTAQDAFVNAAFARWQELTAGLTKTSPARFPHGWYRMDYCLNGDLEEVQLNRFEPLLRQAVTHHSGWPPFWLPDRGEIAPQQMDGAIECWLKPEGEPNVRYMSDPAHCDFWRVTPSGRAFLIRGYQEDGEETFPPGTLFDTTLPIWRMAEVLLHAERLAGLVGKGGGDAATVQFRAHYSGLNGRVLRSWANPLSDLGIQGGAARSDETVLEAELQVDGIGQRLAEAIHPLASSLFERFGVTGLSEERVSAEVQRLLQKRR
ncbi:hypothetical protein [Fodinicurvata sp. EGI_FJ10296]|uniref:hypothetical protein n=1 Tax=Fodinicurvata sp. EGI_FJ10296 TaxID=3231908 RepID=UPI003453BE2D